MRHSTLLLLFSLAISGLLAAQVQYESKVYSVNSAEFVVAADFNRDGRPDIAVSGNGGISVLLNIGAGQFGSPAFYSAASGGGFLGAWEGLLAGDLNNDGWPDLIMSNGEKVSVLLNNQNGTFRSAPQFTPNTATIGLAAAGNFNGDGKLDLVVVETVTGEGINRQLQILKGDGTGAFSAGQILRLSGTAGKVDVEDFNGDGKLDLANVVPTRALIWWGNGDGTFRAPTILTPPTTDPLFSSAPGDFNNDGIADLAVGAAHHCPDDPNHLCGTNTVFIYRNNGAGVFTRVSMFTLGRVDGGKLYASDVNGDQNIDVAVAEGDINTGNFDYAAGKGNGTFGPDIFVTELSNNVLLFRDLDLDSKHDFVQTFDPFAEVVVNLARTGAFTNCAPPGSGAVHAKICVPAGTAVTSPVLVRASGNSPVGIKRLEVWIDGKKQTQRLNDQLARRFMLSPGTHRIAVVAVDKYRGTAVAARQVTVQ
jgi:hypothetical protein